MDDIINTWNRDLEGQVAEFKRQAGEVKEWDKVLIENGKQVRSDPSLRLETSLVLLLVLTSHFFFAVQISKLYAQTLSAEQNNKAIEDSLSYIESQQAELGKLLDGYEGQANEMYEATVGSKPSALTAGAGGAGLDFGPADQERERSYALAENLHSQLDSLSTSLSSMISSVNSLTSAHGGPTKPTESSSAEEPEDPISQISQILDAHLKSLQWIDSASDGMRDRVGEVERRLVDVTGGQLASSTGGGQARLGGSQAGGQAGSGRFGLGRRG